MLVPVYDADDDVVSEEGFDTCVDCEALEYTELTPASSKISMNAFVFTPEVPNVPVTVSEPLELKSPVHIWVYK